MATHFAASKKIPHPTSLSMGLTTGNDDSDNVPDQCYPHKETAEALMTQVNLSSTP
jgi:hypothetical protein